MSTHAASAPTSLPAESSASGAGKALVIGLVGLALSGISFLITPDAHAPALAYLVGLVFWTAVAIGMLMWTMIHHILDASWSVVIRRQFEHGMAAFPWLALLFAPLVIASAMGSHDLVWPWMNPQHLVHGGPETVSEDVLYVKKSGFLNLHMFIYMTAACFLIWSWLSARLRKASFAQDRDGDAKWTMINRKTSALGIVLTAITLTLASIFWVKSLEYHWFSTMYGVWFFANCVRAALGIGVLMMIWLLRRGDYKGVLNTNHFYSIGQLIFAFTIFWAYVTFSQYFLIWNANVPEETFWYNLREIHSDGTANQWKWVGMLILFGHFLLPFLYLLSYKNKIIPWRLKLIVWWTLFTIVVDLCYNVLPALKDAHGDALPFLSMNLIWVATSLVGVGGIFTWAYLRSLPTQKLIPIRDPRISECLTYHE
jgi:hypothetical protein